MGDGNGLVLILKNRLGGLHTFDVARWSWSISALLLLQWVISNSLTSFSRMTQLLGDGACLFFLLLPIFFGDELLLLFSISLAIAGGGCECRDMAFPFRYCSTSTRAAYEWLLPPFADDMLWLLLVCGRRLTVE